MDAELDEEGVPPPTPPVFQPDFGVLSLLEVRFAPPGVGVERELDAPWGELRDELAEPEVADDPDDH